MNRPRVAAGSTKGKSTQLKTNTDKKTKKAKKKKKKLKTTTDISVLGGERVRGLERLGGELQKKTKKNRGSGPKKKKKKGRGKRKSNIDSLTQAQKLLLRLLSINLEKKNGKLGCKD